MVLGRGRDLVSRKVKCAAKCLSFSCLFIASLLLKMCLLFTIVVGAIVMALAFCLWFSSQDTAKTKKVVAIDCEMVRCVPNEEWIKNAREPNKHEVKVAVHCAIVDYDLQVIYDEFICPPMEVKDWQGYHRCHHQEQVKEGTPFYNAREEVRKLLRGKLVVVHHFYHDFDALQISSDIPKENIRDTSTFKPLRNKAGEDVTKPYVKLKMLAKAILGQNIQKNKPHNPVEDAKAAMDLYKVVEQEWENCPNLQYPDTDCHESNSDSE